MYVEPNYKTKKALREAVAAGKYVSVYCPGGWTNNPEGWVPVEGSHYPAPHTWYARVNVVEGRVVAVK